MSSLKLNFLDLSSKIDKAKDKLRNKKTMVTSVCLLSKHKKSFRFIAMLSAVVTGSI